MMLDYISIIIILLLIYISFFRPYILARKIRKCSRCGNCCKLLVKLGEKEKIILEKKGYKNFLDPQGFIIKKEGYCQFLRFEDGKTSCSIEKIKPKICKNFPFRKSFLGKNIDTRCKNFYFKMG